ncbi:hypothetical protein RHSIM_Rhsim03G0114700 [Rhododendron simsii]|uniref:MULE transposase domain-containing protein n=1 Tax=Rhododendron simsii TaxID=118357 RepID=A0A834LPR3_RHOSS|nr:hypothetical protein RHSIM_Rhsim03G0114700 [Rhododendron simsii]
MAVRVPADAAYGCEEEDEYVDAKEGLEDGVVVALVDEDFSTMEGENPDIGGFQTTMGFTNEDFSELNDIVNLTATNNIEEISEFYKSIYSTNDSGSVEEKMPVVENGESRELSSLLVENFLTREELLDRVRKVALKEGFVTTIKKSKQGCYVIIGCDRGGKYRGTSVPLNERKKISGSRLINCPFELWGKKKGSECWKVEIKNASHNHEPSKDMSGHPYCRRFSNEEILSIKRMTTAGIPPRQILTSLRQSNPNCKAIARTVYNAKANITKVVLAGRTMIQALFDELGQGDFTFDIKRDGNGRLTHLFFAHPSSIALTKSYPYVFVMDCTYKTNKYKMPLLDIVGVSSFNGSFYSCFAFMQKEEEGDYVWALERFSKILGHDQQPSVILSDRELALMNAIKVVFPGTANILCVWHIEKNVLSKCKSQFERGEDWETFLLAWTNLIESPDESSFDEAWRLLEVEYKEKEYVLNYIKNNWLPFKERFVHAWTGKHLHFGNRVTSRAEGAHGMLKKYLTVSTGNFNEVREKICLAIENQYNEIKAKIASEKLRVTHKFRIPILKELVSHVSNFALGELFKQHALATSSILGPCRGHFSKTMGLPCAHMMTNKKGESLLLSDIHPQWRIDIRSFTNVDGGVNGNGSEIECLLKNFHDKYKCMPLVEKEDSLKQIAQLIDAPIPLTLEPSIQPHKGRPSGSKKRKGDSSTTRDPSAFEIAEKTRKCSVCHQIGHNSRTCPHKDENTSRSPHFVLANQHVNINMPETQ